MTEFKTTLTNFFICFCFFFRKTVFRPVIFITGIVIPLILTVVMCYIAINLKPDSPHMVKHSSVGNSLFLAGVLFLGTCFSSMMSLPNNLALDRIHNRLKIYLTLGISQNVYLAGNISGLFAIYFPFFLIQLIATNFALKIYLSFGLLLSIIAINVVIFFLLCLLGVFVSTLSKSDKLSHAINTLTMFISLFLTGLIIPNFLFDHYVVGLNKMLSWVGKVPQTNYAWSKFVQFLTPLGTGIYFVQRILIFVETGVDLCSWDVDWIGIALQLGIGIAIYFTCVRRFHWK